MPIRLIATKARVEELSELLKKVHGVSESKIDRIPHGIPNFPSASQSKDLLGVEGKSVILTFGLLSPDKGIEHVIDALPAVLERYPDTVYIVLGATHPHVKEHHGELTLRSSPGDTVFTVRLPVAGVDGVR